MAAEVRYWLHVDDPVFEAFGGIYIPYRTQEEALAQAANDLLYFNDDPSAIGLKGIFKAEYGGHERIPLKSDAALAASAANSNWGYDYNRPLGHLNADQREKIFTPSQIVKQAPKIQRQTLDELVQAHERHLRGMQDAVRRGIVPDAEMSVPGNAYSIVTGGTATGGAVALVAATAKTVIAVVAGGANQPSIVEVAVSFDGTAATAIPVLVEWISGTVTTAGTNTAMTPKQLRGWPGQSSQNSGAINYTAEGTVMEVFKKRLLTPNGGIIIQQQPMGREPTGIVTATTQFKLIGVRLTAPATVNTHSDLEYEE